MLAMAAALCSWNWRRDRIFSALIDAYRVIEAHGGTISASAGDRAVRFEIELPRAGEEDDPLAGARQRASRVILAARDTGIVRLLTAVMEAEGRATVEMVKKALYTHLEKDVS